MNPLYIVGSVALLVLVAIIATWIKQTPEEAAATRDNSAIGVLLAFGCGVVVYRCVQILFFGGV